MENESGITELNLEPLRLYYDEKAGNNILNPEYENQMAIYRMRLNRTKVILN